MDIKEVQVKTQSGDTFSLTEDPEKAVSALEEDGCVLLKGASGLDVCEPAMTRWYLQRGEEKCREEHGSLGSESILECIHRDVILNRAVASVLFSKYDSFLVSPQVPLVHWTGVVAFEGMKRINSAPIYNLENGLVLVNCTHFGGDSSVLWRLTVASGSHKGGSGSTNVEIKANGGDIFMFNGALIRSVPCLIEPSSQRAFSLPTLYWRGDCSPLAGVKEPYRKRILEVGGEECTELSDNGFTNAKWSLKN